MMSCDFAALHSVDTAWALQIQIALHRLVSVSLAAVTVRGQWLKWFNSSEASTVGLNINRT